MKKGNQAIGAAMSHTVIARNPSLRAHQAIDSVIYPIHRLLCGHATADDLAYNLVDELLKVGPRAPRRCGRQKQPQPHCAMLRSLPCTVQQPSHRTEWASACSGVVQGVAVRDSSKVLDGAQEGAQV